MKERYIKNSWQEGDIITSEKLNNIEDGIEYIYYEWDKITIGDYASELIDARYGPNDIEKHPTLGHRLNHMDNVIKNINMQFDYVDVRTFGVKADCIYNGKADCIPVGTDNTIAFQTAIDYCIANKIALYIPAGKYLITDTLQVHGNLTLKGQSMSDSSLIFELLDCNKNAIEVSGCRSTWENLTLECAGYLGKAGIMFKNDSGDNQSMKLTKIHINTFRYGVATLSPETINRIVFTHCQFVSNMQAGIFFESYRDGEGWGHSAPVTFYDCMCNANGVQDWMKSFTYKGIPIFTPNDKPYGYQAYFRGITNLAWYGGQLSNHIDAKNLAMLHLQNVNGVVFDGFDIEDLKSSASVGLNGNTLTSYGDLEGSAILLNAVRGSFFRIQALYNIQSHYLFKIVYGLGTHVIDFVKDLASSFEYSVDTIGTNYNQTGNLCKLSTSSDLSQFSANALGMVVNQEKSTLTKVFDPNYIRPVCTDVRNDWLFDYVYDHKIIDNLPSYAIGYWGDNTDNLDLSKSCYIEKEVFRPEYLSAIIYTANSVYTPDCKFFIAQYEGEKLLKMNYYTLRGDVPIKTQGIANDVFGVYAKCKCEENTTKVRYGFILSGTYMGDIVTHGEILGFEVNAYYLNNRLLNLPCEATNRIEKKNNKMIKYKDNILLRILKKIKTLLFKK